MGQVRGMYACRCAATQPGQYCQCWKSGQGNCSGIGATSGNRHTRIGRTQANTKAQHPVEVLTDLRCSLSLRTSR